MERLTFEGNFCEIAKCLETPGGSFCEKGTCSQRKIWERLKAYEDICDDPAEVKAAMQLLRCYQDAFNPARVHDLAELGDIEHIRDLLQAERDGRLAILPCKAGGGETVWRIVDMESHTAYKDFISKTVTRPLGIPYRDITGGISLIHLEAFGKTVFFSEEEAEAVLKGGAYK